jgi:hypothetical protein
VVVQEAYIQGILTRSVDDLVKAMGRSSILKSQVSPLSEEIDVRFKAFLEHSIEGDWPYVGVDAKRVLKLDRLRLRGPNGGKDKFFLTSTAQNLRKIGDVIGSRFINLFLRTRKGGLPSIPGGSKKPGINDETFYPTGCSISGQQRSEIWTTALPALLGCK